FGITAFIGNPTDAGKGYYKPATANGAPATTTGKLAGCGMQDIDTRWLEVQGKTASCASLSDEDRRRCRMAPADWKRLNDRRKDCGFPERGRGADERAAGPMDDKGSMLITTAILNPGAGEITGFSSRGQRDLDT